MIEQEPCGEPYESVADNQPGLWWHCYVRRIDNQRRVMIRTQMPHLVAQSDQWWIQATMPEPRKSVQPAQWTRSA